MTDIFSGIKQKLTEFKSWIEAPRLYIADELEKVKREIDVETESLLMKSAVKQAKIEEGMTCPDTEKINSNRKQMIDEVDALEAKIFAKLTTNKLYTRFFNKLVAFTKNCDSKLHELAIKQSRLSADVLLEELSELEHSINDSIYEFDCKLKQNSSVMFLNMFELKIGFLCALNCGTKETLKNMFYSKHHPDSATYNDVDNSDDFEINHELTKSFHRLNSSTTIGVLYVLNDCVSKESYK